MTNTPHKMDTHSFTAGFITAAILFMLPVLLVPNIRATYVETPEFDMETQDIDGDGIDDAFDADFGVSSSEVYSSSSEAFVSSSEDIEIEMQSSEEMHQAAGICEDGIDNDTDGDIDDLDDDCDEGTSVSSSSSADMDEDCFDGVDNDGDGDTDGMDDDCM